MTSTSSTPDADAPETDGPAGAAAAPDTRDPPALIQYILARYHEVHRLQLPELLHLAARVESVHDEHAQVPRGLTALLQAMHMELLAHMEKEETVLFPMLARGGHPFAIHPINAMRPEHDDHAVRLAQLLALTHDAAPPDDACSTWRQLYASVRQFANDLQQHIRLENEVLFPKFEPSRG